MDKKKSHIFTQSVTLLLTLSLALPSSAGVYAEPGRSTLRQRSPEKGTPSHAGLEESLGQSRPVTAGLEEPTDAEVLQTLKAMQGQMYPTSTPAQTVTQWLQGPQAPLAVQAHAAELAEVLISWMKPGPTTPKNYSFVAVMQLARHGLLSESQAVRSAEIAFTELGPATGHASLWQALALLKTLVHSRLALRVISQRIRPLAEMIRNLESDWNHAGDVPNSESRTAAAELLATLARSGAADKELANVIPVLSAALASSKSDAARTAREVLIAFFSNSHLEPIVHQHVTPSDLGFSSLSWKQVSEFNQLWISLSQDARYPQLTLGARAVLRRILLDRFSEPLSQSEALRFAQGWLTYLYSVESIEWRLGLPSAGGALHRKPKQPRSHPKTLFTTMRAQAI